MLKQEETEMKRILAVLVCMSVLLISSIGYTYDGKGRGNRSARVELLNQLPAEKEMLFHQTMRDVRGKNTPVHAEIKALKAEIRDILIAKKFNEALFLEKTRKIQELRTIIRQARTEAIAKLAKQFTREERTVLAELTPQKQRHHGRLRLH
jgi:uncharacterized membrane protein